MAGMLGAAMRHAHFLLTPSEEPLGNFTEHPRRHQQDRTKDPYFAQLFAEIRANAAE